MKIKEETDESHHDFTRNSQFILGRGERQEEISASGRSEISSIPIPQCVTSGTGTIDTNALDRHIGKKNDLHWEEILAQFVAYVRDRQWNVEIPRGTHVQLPSGGSINLWKWVYDVRRAFLSNNLQPTRRSKILQLIKGGILSWECNPADCILLKSLQVEFTTFEANGFAI